MRVLSFIGVLLCCFLSGITAQSSIKRIPGSPYPYSTPPDLLYVTSETSYSYSEKIALQSLQGVIAQTKPEILRDMYGDRALVGKLGIKMDFTYYSNFQGLLTHFANKLAGYILCDAKQNSTNVAFSLAGILNGVAIPADIEQTAKTAGLTMLLDVRGKDETWLFTNYGTQFSKQIASYQNVSDDRGLYLADYSAFAKAIQFWSSTPISTLANNVFNTISPNGAVMGWGPGEDNTVAALSKKSLMIHAADFAPNLSTLTNIQVDNIQQKEPVTPFKVIPNVHTVCFVMSDGDNIQWLLGASDDAKTWADPLRSKVDLGWTISPALVELAPPMYKKYVDNSPTTIDGRNYLIAAPSGRGYFNPGLFPNLSAEGDLLNKYMKKGDLHIANVIDVDNSPRNLEPYLRQDNIDALFYYNYSDYSGLNGSISWYKDKPSIGGRYNLWLGTLGQATDKTPQTLADKLNVASTNISSSSGYSLIPVIVWSRKVSDVLECIGKLGPNVRVVAPDEFVWLIRKNIKHVALGVGNGLKGDYYSGNTFNTLKYSQTDRTVDFDWATGSPNQTILGSDNFSVKWTGQVQPVYSEVYTFYVTAETGAKLTVNGTVLFDNLAGTGVTTQSGTIELTSEQKYDIELEYSKSTGNASCKMEWQSTSQMRQTVPKLQLYTASDRVAPSSGVVTAYADCTFTGFSGGLKAGTYTLSELNAIGIYDNDIASLKVTKGFKAILYEDDNFGGASIELTADSTCLGDWSDRISSLKITTTGERNLEGTYFLQNLASNFNMDVTGGVASVADGVNIQQSTVTPNTNQQFKLSHLGDGTYKILAVHSNKSLDVANGSKSEGANVQQWTYYGLQSQQFIITPATTPGYYNLIAKHSGKIVETLNSASQANVRQLSNSNQTKGQWKLVPVPPLLKGSGNGLNASYYNGMNFETLRRNTIDTTINFNWGNNAPNTYVGTDNYSVRWNGYIQPQTTGNYTFFINSDNGRRLWINDQLIIDKWVSDYGIEYSGNITLNANQLYTIKVEYFEEAGGASCILEWMSDVQPRATVPKSQLYTAITAVNDVKADGSGINVYPMPITNKKMHVQLSGFDYNENVSLIVYDLVGKSVLQTRVNNSGVVDLNGISSGTYIVSVQNEGHIANKRVVLL
jgi:hypothetical protein